MSIDIEQLAKEWIKQNLPEGGDCCEIAFFAGYQAAINSLEKQDSCEHIFDMEKMVDVTCSSGWISVYERMPEKNKKVKVLINYFLEGTQIREVTEAFFRNGLWSGDGVHITHPLVSHWMPLPKPPEEEK